MNRRPIKSRNSAVARWITRWLASTPVQPNHISLASMVVAAVAGIAFYASANTDLLTQSMLLLLAAVMCQVRLLCNLLDGMLATEAGKGTRTGAVWNEFPDRIADLFIFVGIGFAIGWPAMGWAAASMAILTAYVRELGSHVGGKADYGGPMAKPHRMAVVTVAALLAIIELWWLDDRWMLQWSLWIVFAGALITCVKRVWRLLAGLK